MSKVAHYLQEHLVGEVMTSPDARRYFATDASVFVMAPAMVVYPRNEQDVRKTMRFAWQLAERGRSIPVTARGSGTDLSGAAIGNGVMLVFPAHMNRVIEFDSKTGGVIVEPGINYGKLQQTLHTHGRFLPPYPASYEYSTIGGAVANNASGEKSIKYGNTGEFVESLRVVLANGEVIETRRLGKRELSKKLGLQSFEGEIYRSIDTLIEESRKILPKSQLKVSRNVAGYNLADVKHKDGSFDLTPLFVGSQGTLGIVVETTLRTESYNPEASLVIANFDDLRQAQSAIQDLKDMSDLPSAIELVDASFLETVESLNPNQLKDLVTKPYPKITLLVEFEGNSERQLKKVMKKVSKIFDNLSTSYHIEHDPEKQASLWKIRHASATILARSDGNTRAVPIIDDGVVPLDRLAEFIESVRDMFDRNGLQPAIWGHAGEGSLHIQPFLELDQIGDRQKVFRLMDEYYSLVTSLGGSISGEYNDGRLRGPYLEALYGAEIYEVFQKVKQIFDPYKNLNPGVKIDVSLDDIKPLLRHEYGLEHLYQHMPRS